MKEFLSVGVDSYMIEVLEKLKKAKKVWLSELGMDIYFGDSRNIYEANVLSFYRIDDAKKLIKVLNLNLDKKEKNDFIN